MGSNHIIAILSTISCGAIQWCAFATAALKFFYKMGPDKIIENVEYSLCNSVVHIWNYRIEEFPHNGYWMESIAISKISCAIPVHICNCRLKTFYHPMMGPTKIAILRFLKRKKPILLLVLLLLLLLLQQNPSFDWCMYSLLWLCCVCVCLNFSSSKLLFSICWCRSETSWFFCFFLFWVLILAAATN